jgi:hypothetical protein
LLRRFSIFIIVLVVAESSEREVFAQSRAEREARESFLQGVESMRQERFDAAISSFELSYSVLPRCSTQYNLLVCYERTRQFSRAVRTLTQYVADCDSTMSAQNRSYVLNAGPRLNAQVARITLHITPTSTVSTVSIDQHVRADWRDEMVLDVGSHSVQIHTRDGRTVARNLEVFAGQQRTVDVTLDTVTEPVPSRVALASNPYGDDTEPGANSSSRLRIASTVSRSTVLLDGLELGRAPLEPELPSGAHELELRAEGHQPARMSLNVTNGVVTQLIPNLERVDTATNSNDAFYTRWWFWTLVGAAAIGGAIAITWELTRPTDTTVYTFQAITLP